MKRLFLLSLLSLFTSSLFAQGVNPKPWSFQFGYVNKGWSTDIDGKTIHENLWGQEDKKLHGFQFGITYSPTLPIGLGIDTGLFYECYISESEVVHDAGFDDFTEHNIYIPLHAQYRIPITPEFSISLYGGIGMNIVLDGTYNITEYYAGYTWGGGRPYGGSYSYIAGYQEYDEGDWPKRFNLQYEVGLKFNISNFVINAGYAWGATNHNFYEGYDTHQNKLSIGLGYNFAL
jgi:hypothetical protein